MGVIPAVHNWRTNAELIRDVASLGYLKERWSTLDATYGLGNFWTLWRPVTLVTNDLAPDSLAMSHHDFRHLPWPDHTFEAVVFDPPYKLNGRPGLGDERYGVHEQTSWYDRMALIKDGAIECARVCAGNLLVKCQDQVCSGKVRWQTDMVSTAVRNIGLTKIDRFDMLGGAPQPEGRRQIHARGRGSSLLIFSR